MTPSASDPFGQRNIALIEEDGRNDRIIARSIIGTHPSSGRTASVSRPLVSRTTLHMIAAACDERECATSATVNFGWLATRDRNSADAS